MKTECGSQENNMAGPEPRGAGLEGLRQKAAEIPLTGIVKSTHGVS